MKNFIYRGKTVNRVGFFGFGKSNEALLKLLMRSYPHLSFILRSDTDVSAPFWAEKTYTGRAARENFSEDVLFLSPSVRRDAPKLYEAKEHGLIISSDIEFFFEYKKIPVYALTGSDGKSTTASLTSMILGDGYPPSANYGTPVCELLDDPAVRGTVAELSSFQLTGFLPKADRSLITNITPNHLDWHSSMDDYISAKENLVRLSDKRIFNFDCQNVRELLKKYPAFAIFSTEKSYAQLRDTLPANHYFTLEDGYVCHSGAPLFSRTEIRISGEHNLKNFLAAAALTAELCSTDDLLRAAHDFRPLSHRCERVYEYGGISFYDSSIDSTPERTKTTLHEMRDPTVLILGGRSKGVSYSRLLPLCGSVKTIIITGENRHEIFEALGSDVGVPTLIEEDFEKAVLLAIRTAVPGDAVLLSPASTSYDRFSDYKERADFFKEIIKHYYAE